MLMIGKQLSAEQRLSKAVVDIMGNPKYIALAGVLMIGSRVVDDKVKTACTNGRDEKYGRAFIETLSDAELRFLVLHECYHKLYRQGRAARCTVPWHGQRTGVQVIGG